MNVCPSCGKSNQAHYKFCLGCGAELTGAAPKVPTAQMAASAPVAETPAPTVNDPFDDPTFRGGELPEVPTDPDVPETARTLDEAPAPEGQNCDACGTFVGPGFRFCPNCGAPMAPSGPAATAARAAARPGTPGQLTLIRPDGTDGATHPLKEGENRIGRTSGPLFEADGYLSPFHAELVLNAAGLVVRDANSLNGVFYRITEEEELQDGDVLRIGQELLRFDVVPPAQPLDDGTDILGSPNPGYWGRLAVVVGREQDGSAFPLLNPTCTLGRERGDIIFAEDGYVSGMHARIEFREGRVFFRDLNSSNGSFLRIRGERPLPPGSLILMGQQLFRVDY
jgi:pSer/pThr/pTyr-binding forkhead associated (FHA) protein